MEEVVYEDIQYKGKNGSLTLNDELLHYQAYPPNKTAVKCSLALLLKRQVSPKSASQQYIKLVTRSGKTAAFYVKDRVVLEEIREDMRGRIDKMKQKRAQQKQKEQQRQQDEGGGMQRQQSRGRSNPMQQLISLLSPGAAASDSAQRLLEDDELQVLKRKYAREIRQDAEINELQQQIQEYQNKLKQQRVQKGQMLKDKFQIEKDQMLLGEQTLRLKFELQEIILQNDEKYQQQQSGGSRNKRIQLRRDYTKAVQKATSNNKKPSPGMYSMANNSSNNLAGKEFSRKAEKEATLLETDILQSMHQQMAMQNQSSLAQKHTLIMKSALMREKTQIDNDYAEGLQFQMVLEGTQNALSNMYPDIVLRLEYLIDKYERLIQGGGKDKMNGNDSKKLNGGDVPHLILSPEAMKLKAGRRPSVTKSDGISDLGESLHRGRGGRRDQPQRVYHPPATMTTVHSLQQNSLSQMAGIEN